MKIFKIVLLVLIFMWAGVAVAGEEVIPAEKLDATPLDMPMVIETDDAPGVTESKKVECPSGLSALPGGCYIIFDDVNGKRIFIHTRKQLMQNKSAVWSAKNAESKAALEVSKVLRAKLMKLPEVSGVTIAARSVLVSVYILDNIPMLGIRMAFAVLQKE